MLQDQVIQLLALGSLAEEQDKKNDEEKKGIAVSIQGFAEELRTARLLL